MLLGRTLVVRDRAAARRLLSLIPADGRAVTLQGELFYPSGPIVRPAQGEAATAPRRFQEAQVALAGVEQQLQAVEAERGQALLALEREQSMPRAQVERQISLARESEGVARGLAQQLALQLDAAQAELAELQGRRSAGQAETDSLQANLKGWEAETEAVAASLHQRAERLQALQVGLDEQSSLRAAEEEQERGLRDRLRGVDARYTQSQIELARRQEELASLERRIQDDFGLVSFEQEETTTVQEPLPLEGLVEHLIRVTALPEGLETELARLRGQMRRIGPVNPEAWTEYQEVQERERFLSTQLEDLRKAEGQLQEVIEQLDALMQLEFSRTFEAVALAFQEYFTRLFKGGSAKLRLHQGEDLNEAGIEIEVRLPGKREQGLSMLSGGERSLTAMALIFALLKLSPTPFCVLDEVDAMLDESNVLRFGEILRELSQNTQFLVITHNRQTIQQAEVVYGVSLGRDNASEVISLRLEEAEKALAT
jgi:chromosome segregation protein